ncbi:MAG: hypothetical protein MZV70_08235 [Desulfobacterales bacterium]|nr:hypothetical protein [Desulfobacterales bacterium]
MTSEIILKKGKFSKTLLKNFQNYYGGIGVDPRFVAVKWHEWVDYPDVVVFKAEKTGKWWDGLSTTRRKVLLKKS